MRLRLSAALLLVAAVIASPRPAEAQNRYVHANNSPYDTLDPHAVNDVGRAASRINLYDGLYRWVDNPPKMIPWLAESHTASPDGLTYTVKLRAGVKFHDGTEMTAADVVYSMERMLGMKKGPASFFLGTIEPGTTQAPDKLTVVFRLKEPSAIFAAVLPEIQVVNSALVKKNEKDGDWGETWLSKNDAGSGSFALRRYDPAVGFIATRFKDHFLGWEPGRKWFDEIEFRSILDTNTRVLGLIKGDWQGVDGYLPYDQIERLRKEPSIQVLEQESMRVFLFCINASKPPFDNVHFRRALSYAFDYDGFINDILKGSVARNPTSNPNNLWGTPKDVKGYVYDLDKAKEELQKYGGPLRPITINALAGFAESEQASVLLANSLRKIGIDARVETSPWSLVSQRFLKAETMLDMVPLWKSTFYADPNNWVGELFSTRYLGGRNLNWYSNPALDKLTEAALKTTDQAERARLYEAAVRLVVDEAANIFVYNTKWFGPYSNKIDGIRFSPVGNGQEMRWAYYK
ncbi:MAG: ABC transporter substrate-binding protein [Alphaproteobacteria bacterium]|nr:ABC transporter substrate-binding protein [Alphaproteobacteria bacterium]